VFFCLPRNIKTMVWRNERLSAFKIVITCRFYVIKRHKTSVMPNNFTLLLVGRICEKNLRVDIFVAGSDLKMQMRALRFLDNA